MREWCAIIRYPSCWTKHARDQARHVAVFAMGRNYFAIPWSALTSNTVIITNNYTSYNLTPNIYWSIIENTTTYYRNAIRQNFKQESVEERSQPSTTLVHSHTRSSEGSFHSRQATRRATPPPNQVVAHATVPNFCIVFTKTIAKLPS